MKLGRSLAWDGATERINGDKAAKKLLRRDYRPGYEYPGEKRGAHTHRAAATTARRRGRKNMGQAVPPEIAGRAGGGQVLIQKIFAAGSRCVLHESVPSPAPGPQRPGVSRGDREMVQVEPGFSIAQSITSPA